MLADKKIAIGRRGEDLAVRFLLDQGYEILERNYRWRRGEIDIVAEEGEAICFVEVRARSSAVLGHPLETIGPDKQERLAAGAACYLASHPRAARKTARFDVVSILLRPRLEISLLRNAFSSCRPW